MEIRAFCFETDLVDAFVELPFRLYGRDEKWIPPFKEEVKGLLSPRNFFFRHGEIRNFLALEGGRAVGRVSAIVNRDLKDVGLVGFFECEERPEAARVLLDAAAAWLGEKGFRTVWGPMQFSIWHSYRFMTKGFDREPFYGEPYNPPFYPEFFARGGFEPLARWRSWDLDARHLEILHAGARRFHRQRLLDEGFRSVPIDLGRLEEELRRLHVLAASSFRENFGWTPIDFEEFQALYGGLRHIAIADLVRFVIDPGGKPVGMVYGYPDIGPVVRRMKGESGVLAKVKFLFGKSRVERLVFHTIAVLEERRSHGLVETLIAEPLLEAARKAGFSRAVGALAKEGTSAYEALWRAGARRGADVAPRIEPPTREYAIFRKSL
ncbi:MAG: hypothetical protein HYY16_03260 [Planctomycetes bacterium]|nr:hypothetical protein [Planctomycetota bacterium]